jgi:radical SAM superfamily enzyme YgiQ (UPF0313 family)
MKIALINPRVESYSSTLPPLGLLYIAAVLEKEGFEVMVFDPHPDNDSELDHIINYQPDIIGLSILTTYVQRAKNIISILKERLKNSILIVGGVHPTVLPEKSLSLFGADVVVVGEGEITMRELVLSLNKDRHISNIKGIVYKNNQDIIKNPPRELIEDLDSIPFPARDLVDFEKYLFPPGIIRGYWSERSTSLITSRGCPFHCIFCGSQAIFGRRVRRRSVENVINELKVLINNYGIDSVWFIDDTFTINKRWVNDFCNAVIHNDLKIKWGCQARVNTVHEETLSLMKSAGLVQLDFGVESGSDKVLKALKKDSNEVTIRNAFRITKKVGVRTLATFIFNNPSEEKEDIVKTFMLAKEINPDFVSSFFLTPFPGTELMDMANANNWITDKNYIEGGLKKKPIMRINFSEEELYEIRRRFQSKFMLRNYMSLFLNIPYMYKAFLIAMKYPLGLYCGVKAFIKSRVFDDFVFAFLIYYADKKQK